MASEVAHPRPVDGDSAGEIPERHAHRLDAIRHREEPLHVVIGDDESHDVFRQLALLS